jgi:hypothetical protein
MVVDWEQETGLLMTSGDVRVIRIWDTEREMKVQVKGNTLNITSPFINDVVLKCHRCLCTSMISQVTNLKSFLQVLTNRSIGSIMTICGSVGTLLWQA